MCYIPQGRLFISLIFRLVCVMYSWITLTHSIMKGLWLTLSFSVRRIIDETRTERGGCLKLIIPCHDCCPLAKPIPSIMNAVIMRVMSFTIGYVGYTFCMISISRFASQQPSIHVHCIIVYITFHRPPLTLINLTMWGSTGPRTSKFITNTQNSVPIFMGNT